MLNYISKPGLLLLMLTLVTFSCSRQEDGLFAENVNSVPNNNKNYTGPTDYLTDIGTINIAVLANGNYPGQNNPKFIKDISAPNFGYCHPDVQYFPNGFNGYKYWMVFTPYNGAVGANVDSKRYENPTVVVSNDGLTWRPPAGISNPIQRTPTNTESTPENANEPIQGFWSDVDWMYENGKFLLYYRGSFMKAKALKARGAKSQNNFKKLTKTPQRAIVRQTSTDGISWTPLEVAYTSNAPHSPNNNHILSPSFVYTGKNYVSYEVENNISPNFPGNDASYIIMRTSDNGLDFSNFKKSKVVNFMNKPWTDIDPVYAPWHIQAAYVDGYYFLCIAAGNVRKFTSEALFLAVSKDGINFKTFPKAMVEKNVYRSSVFPMTTTSEAINFGAVVGFKNGVFTYREFQLSKPKLEDFLAK
ncbi:hypothetical protein [Chryseobacterium indologenes]|uniref:hypothetical protein n=2 Tax=Chryseobacterium indologenes TaxID=253 RepID=UPI001E497E10|nr:hypothetical protein [Chryseobacterium indologenes]